MKSSSGTFVDVPAKKTTNILCHLKCTITTVTGQYQILTDI